MTKIKTTLNRKLGPLPVWAWLLLVSGAIALGLWLRNRQGGAYVPPDELAAEEAPFEPLPTPGPTDGNGEPPEVIYLPGFPEDDGSGGTTGGGLPDVPPPQEPDGGYTAPVTTQEAAGSFPTAPVKTQDLTTGVLRWNFARCKANPARSVWHRNAADKALFKRHINCRGFTIAEYKAKFPAAMAFWGW